jgi:hypothetical protein
MHIFVHIAKLIEAENRLLKVTLRKKASKYSQQTTRYHFNRRIHQKLPKSAIFLGKSRHVFTQVVNIPTCTQKKTHSHGSIILRQLILIYKVRGAK